MPGEPLLIYLDACVLLSYIDGDEDRLPIIDELFRRARAGELELITSVLSQIEVAFSSTEKEQQALSAEVETMIDQLWLPASPVETVELFDQIAWRARGLIRQAMSRGESLKPPDAIHLATAERLRASQLFSYDTGLPKFADLIEIPIGAPHNPQEPITGFDG
jgi:predicted nucleic acid-binding protein